MATRMKTVKPKPVTLSVDELTIVARGLGEQNLSFAAGIIQSQGMELDSINSLIDKIQTVIEAELVDHNFAMATVVGLTGKLLNEWEPKEALIQSIN